MFGPDSSLIAEDDLCSRFKRALLDKWKSDTHLVGRGRNLTADCVIQIGTVPFLLRLKQGRLGEISKATSVPFRFVPFRSVVSL